MALHKLWPKPNDKDYNLIFSLIEKLIDLANSISVNKKKDLKSKKRLGILMN